MKYKLGNYKEATQHYLEALEQGVITEANNTDFITNILACSANDVTQADIITNTLSKMSFDGGSDYELFFNESQSQLKR